MAYIEEREGKKGKSFRVTVRKKGFEPVSATFYRRSDAIRWGEDVEHALLNNLPLPGEDLPLDDKSLPDAINAYIAIVEKIPRRSKHTIACDREAGKRLAARFKGLSLRTLTREDIEAHKLERLRVVGPSSVRQDMTMLSRIYETARIEWRMSGLEYPGKDVKLPSPPPGRTVILMPDQIPALLAECAKSKNPMLRPLVMLLLETGMRPEEAVTMRWWQVENGMILLPETKTDPRRIPISDEAIALLRGLKPESASQQSLIFITEDRLGQDKPVRYFRRAFEQACVRARINEPLKRDVGKAKGKDLESIKGSARRPRVTLYTLRHSSATYLLMSGADLRTVADILGHSNVTQTMRYTHMLDEHKRAAMNNQALPWKQK